MNTLLVIMDYYGLSHLLVMVAMAVTVVVFDWDKFYYEEGSVSEQNRLFLFIGAGIMVADLIGLLYLLSPIYFALAEIA